MGCTLIEYLLRRLNELGVRAIRAYKDGLMPDIESPVVTAEILELDQEKETQTMLVTVFSPVSFGLVALEKLCTKLMLFIPNINGVCRREQVKYLKDPELYCVEIYATFYGTETARGWVTTAAPPMPPTCICMVGDKVSTHVESIDVYREISDTVTDIENAKWRFKLVLNYPLDAEELILPMKLLNIRFSRQYRYDFLGGCVVERHERKFTPNSVVEILEGSAYKYNSVHN